MVNRSLIPEDSEEGFIRGFHRYFLITHILSSDSWEDLEKNLRIYEKEKAGEYINILYKEFQFYNLIKDIEYDIADTLFSALINKRKLRSHQGIENLLISKIKKYRGINDRQDVKNLIQRETLGKNRYLLSPHLLYFVSGCGIGDLMAIIRDNFNDFDKKENLLKELEIFNDIRTKIIHNLLSSRINYKEEIKKGLNSGKKINEIIRGCQDVKDYEENLNNK
ncbi:MAG: hypothetical protein WC410_00505 [Candidatus Paceibacterota bacterium]|jgi:hypothetical protein